MHYGFEDGLWSSATPNEVVVVVVVLGDPLVVKNASQSARQYGDVLEHYTCKS